MSATFKNAKRVFEFDVPNLITRQASWGRTTTVRVDTLTVTIDEVYGLHVLARGRVIRRDGSEGQGYRDIAWTEGDYLPERDLDNAPRWVRDAVAEAVDR